MNGTSYAASTSTQTSTLSAPHHLSAPFTSAQLMIAVASISSVAFFLLVLVLLAALYRRDLHCCKARPYQEPQPYLEQLSKSCAAAAHLQSPLLREPQIAHASQVQETAQEPKEEMVPRPDAPPQYYSNSQTLEGSSRDEHNFEMIREDNEAQQQRSGQLFVIGLPSSYCLPSQGIPFPRLPSYESVRKKDRQRQIHMMIADRFGLSTAVLRELPPTYEESVRHSVALTWGSPEPAATSVAHRQPETDHTSCTQCFAYHSAGESCSAFD